MDITNPCNCVLCHLEAVIKDTHTHTHCPSVLVFVFSQSPNQAKGFESVELGELDKREEQQRREKVPRRIIHFSSGETMEEYSTDEEEGEDKEPEMKDLLSSPVDAVRSQMTWGPYFWFHMWRAATSTISACDYLGERMASLFGITSAKYQYAIDEYYRMKKEREEEKEENRLSEEAERTFDTLRSQKDERKPVTGAEQAAHPDVTYRVENENQEPESTILLSSRQPNRP
ncbi:protein FAM177A1-like isoform X1 [Anabas testudineus]|uniref:Family with sequence similarity 177 member A1 n=1 Tax=Anabas testudineus TaxID=64144 RepID=A0AAQ6ICT2_ANATE|nr:protein FAM177A1-like isoform X1 [Anabas testudineus]